MSPAMIAFWRVMGVHLGTKHGRRRRFEEGTWLVDLGEHLVDELFGGVEREPLKEELVDV